MTPEQIDRIKADAGQSTAKALAAEFGVAPTTVVGWWRQVGIRKRGQYRKLTREQIVKAMSRDYLHMSTSALAREFGVTANAVGYYRRMAGLRSTAPGGRPRK